jgi:branched-chain amino acid transport system ATP-binding protein
LTTHRLEARDILMQFGGVKALQGVSATVETGRWLGLIGPNGSGKSTLLNVMSGIYRPTAGTLTLDGANIATDSPRSRSTAGVVRTFQHPQLAASLTLAENVAIGAALGLRRLGASAPSMTPLKRAQLALDAFNCSDFADVLPAEAPYGVRKIAEVARAATAEPSVLLLDEPAAGLSSDERIELVEALRGFGERHPDTAVCLVEHDVPLVRMLCPELVVLNAGRVLRSGAAEDVLADEEVRTAYLGQQVDEGSVTT